MLCGMPPPAAGGKTMIDKRALDVVRFVAKKHRTPKKVVSAVVEKMLPSIRLVPQPATEAELPLGASRIGGCPDLPSRTKWPRCPETDDGPFRFVMQVNLAEVAPFDVAKVLPKKGLL